MLVGYTNPAWFLPTSRVEKEKPIDLDNENNVLDQTG